MKKNKKGFTLIELLAVIVILGIIITIVVSNVVKYVKQARQGSYKDAVGVFVKNVQNSLMSEAVEGGDGTVTTCTTATACKGIYDYDSSNMDIIIAAVQTGKSNHVITIKGTNSFKDLDISGKYCPNHAKCGNGSPIAKGTVILYMSPEGELKDSE